MQHVRICGTCGEEYRPDIERCADCGGALEDRYDDGTAPLVTGPRSGVTPPPPAEPLIETEVVHRADVHEITPFADALAEGGVGFRILPLAVLENKPGPGLALCVAPEDRDKALELVAACLLSGDEVGVSTAVIRDFDAERGYKHCPACAAELAAGLPECPECGLMLAEGDE